jgi:hypothetical protein
LISSTERGGRGSRRPRYPRQGRGAEASESPARWPRQSSFTNAVLARLPHGEKVPFDGRRRRRRGRRRSRGPRDGPVVPRRRRPRRRASGPWRTTPGRGGRERGTSHGGRTRYVYVGEREPTLGAVFLGGVHRRATTERQTDK